MIYGEKQPCYTATSGSMRHYISQTKSRYSGFRPLKSHPDSVIATSDPLSQYLPTMQPKHTLSEPEVQVRAFLSIYSIFVSLSYHFAENVSSNSGSKLCVRCDI